MTGPISNHSSKPNTRGCCVPCTSCAAAGTRPRNWRRTPSFGPTSDGRWYRGRTTGPATCTGSPSISPEASFGGGRRLDELRDMLRWRAASIEADQDALRRVLNAVLRRRHRRRVVAVVACVSVVAAGLAAAGVVRREPNRPVMALMQLAGSRPALAVRAKLGIHGATKGAPPAVVVPTRTGKAIVDVSSGTSSPLPPDLAASGASVSPKGNVVAAVTGNQLVLTRTQREQETKPVVVPNASGTTGSVSWDRGGTELFAPVGGRWVRVSDVGGTS